MQVAEMIGGDIIEEIVSNLVIEANANNAGVTWNANIKSPYDGLQECSIANGSLGIVLVLLEYYNVEHDPKLIPIIDAALCRAYSTFSHPTHRVGLYEGRGGAIYTLISAYKILQDTTYADYALNLCHLDFSKSSFCNINEGLSGLLIGVLHAFEATRDAKLLQVLNNLIVEIISSVKVHINGIYWDEFPFAMGLVNGFLFGNSGIIFSLQQARQVFQDQDVFDNVIIEALAFEDASFNRQWVNWPDYINEKYFFTRDDKKKITRKQLPIQANYFKPDNSMTWSTGLAGSLLPRKELITQTAIYNSALVELMQNINPSNFKCSTDFCLSKGIGGAILAIADFDRPISLKHLTKSLNSQKKKFGELLSSNSRHRNVIDLSLFYGEAGIAYLLLKLNARTTQSILCPSITFNFEFEKNSLSPTEVGDLIISSNFPLKKNKYNSRANLQQSFYERIEKILSSVVNSTPMDPEDKFNLDIYKLKKRDINFNYIRTKLLLIQRTKVRPKYISLGKNCMLISYENKDQVLVRSAQTIEAVLLNPVTREIVSRCVDNEMRYNEVEELVINMVAPADSNQVASFKGSIHKIILSLITAGILDYR